MTAASDKERFAAGMVSMGAFVRRAGGMRRSKSVTGGVFDRAPFSLHSVVMVLDDHFYRVMFFVGVDNDLIIVGAGDTKTEALKGARDVVGAFTPTELSQCIANGAEAFEREEDERKRAHLAWLDSEESGFRIERVVTVPKRRQRIFDKSRGICHYCKTPLDLTGKWHIEHKMPRALFGSSADDNLVASCVPCNMKKKDKTEAEFLSEMEAKEIA